MLLLKHFYIFTYLLSPACPKLLHNLSTALKLQDNHRVKYNATVVTIEIYYAVLFF